MQAATSKAAIACLAITIVLGVFVLTAHAQDCSYCYEQTLIDCGIGDSWDDPGCFYNMYELCIEGCCRLGCEADIPLCRSDCDQWLNECENVTCQQDCEAQCTGDPNYDDCMNVCMEECSFMCWDQWNWCYEDCEMAAEDCTWQCVAGIEPDEDGDGVPDEYDNCPIIPNADQADGDSDNVGDACDNCPIDPNEGQDDIDGDCAGNVCDLCPFVFSNEPYQDTDGDGIGDACDPDIDGDGVNNAADNCPYNDNPGQADGDGDGIGDTCDQTSLIISDHTLLDPMMEYGTIIPNPGSMDEQEINEFGSPLTVQPLDIGNGSTEFIVGSHKREECYQKYFLGFILGDDFDNNPDTDDAVSFKIAELKTTDTILRGIYGASTFAGEYNLNGSQTAFYASRFFTGESGLFSYIYYTLNFPFPNMQSSAAWDIALIDNRTHIVGRYEDAGGWHGFKYERYYDPELLESYTVFDYPGSVGTYACGLNDSGAVVGYYMDSSLVHHGFVYDGAYSPLDVPGALATRAYRINNAGHVTGFFTGSDNRTHAFLLDGSTYVTFDIAGAKDTLSFGLNDNDRVVGYYRDAFGTHPYVADPLETSPCQGDFDGDGDVDTEDAAVMAGAFGQVGTVGFSQADFAPADGDVDGADLSIFAENMGRTDCLP